VAIPYWHKLVAKAKDCGVERFALENFSSMLVWNPETLFRLRDAVGPMVGLNLDPSHLIWMGADPIPACARSSPAAHMPGPLADPCEGCARTRGSDVEPDHWGGCMSDGSEL
jgi:hypothetical protein